MKVGTKVAGALLALVVAGIWASSGTSWFPPEDPRERLVTFIGTFGDDVTPTLGGEMLVYTARHGVRKYDIPPNPHSKNPVVYSVQYTVPVGSHVSLTVHGKGTNYLVGATIAVKGHIPVTDAPSTSRAARVDIQAVP